VVSTTKKIWSKIEEKVNSMSNGNKITFGLLAALIAAKVGMSGSKKEMSDFTGIPMELWGKIIKDPFQNEYVMDILTRNFFINSANDFYTDEMVFVAENLGQKYNPKLCPIKFYLSLIEQPDVQVITSSEMDIKGWLMANKTQMLNPNAIIELDPDFLFMIRTKEPDTRLTLETSQLIADTIGPQLYFDTYHNLIS